MFLLQGQYMHHLYDHLREMEAGSRMLFRSAHIYTLITALVNLILGNYLTESSNKNEARLQTIISALVIIAPFLITAGFFYEPHMEDLARPFSRIGAYALFVASILLIVKALKYR